MGDRLQRSTEARSIEGDLTFRNVEELLRSAVSDQFAGDGEYIWVRDVTDEWVAYEVAYELEGGGQCDTYRVAYSIDESTNAVTFDGEPEKVILKTSYEQVREGTNRLYGRVLEAKAPESDLPEGSRVFAVRIIEAGTSMNGIRYPESVLHSAAPLYEGAKAFDHHRTLEELQTSTTAGLVGHYRNVTPGPGGLDADLVLFPSATHTAEALDASLAAQTAGLPPVVGISHDVLHHTKPATEGGRQIRESTAITAVLSADVVADPSAGGHATRMVAGGLDDLLNHPTLQSKENPAMTLKELLDALRDASADDRAALLSEHAAVLESAGFSVDDVPTLLGETTSSDDGASTTENEPAKEPVAAGAAQESRGASRATEASYAVAGLLGESLIDRACESAGFSDELKAALVADLGDRFTEADLRGAVERTKRIAESIERRGLTPSVPHIEVTKEEADQLAEKVDRTLEGKSGGFVSLRQMFAEIEGLTATDLTSGDVPAQIVREAWGYRREGERARESVTTSTFGEILGDSITRRMIAEYNTPSLALWREIVSSIVPVTDFRTNRRTRMGGYGILPVVGQGAPYQALTTPGDEEATYAVTKKGGTEDLTLEAIANDDLGALRRIPSALGRAAALTLFQFVLDFLADNATCTYDTTALFHTNHANTDTSAGLAQSTLSTGRRKMRSQARKDVSDDVLSIVPKFLLVPNELEEIAFQLCTSAVAIPSTPAGPSDTPNLHQGLTPKVVDYWSDANDWFLVADPAMVPTIELGFYLGQEEPELFVSDDPTQGATFSADKVTYKVRHVYSGTLLDHRGFYRGQG